MSLGGTQPSSGQAARTQELSKLDCDYGRVTVAVTHSEWGWDPRSSNRSTETDTSPLCSRKSANTSRGWQAAVGALLEMLRQRWWREG